MDKILNKKTIFVLLAFVFALSAIYFYFWGFDRIKYNNAVNLVGIGNYEKSISIMEDVGNIDSDEIRDVKYLYIIQCIEDRNIEKAKELLEDIGDFKGTEDLKLEIVYIEAGNIARDNGILDALPLYKTLPNDYKDVSQIIDKINEWSVYVGTWSKYYDSLNTTDVCDYNIYFEDSKVYCRADNWRNDLNKLEIVNQEAKFSFQSMTFFVDGMIIDYDGDEFKNLVKGTGANKENTIISKTSGVYNVSIRDTIKGTTNPDADDYYEHENAGTIIAEKEKEYDSIVNSANTQKGPSIGMSKNEIEASTWGKPKKINKTTYEWGTTEQWCYSNYRYIYFKNGVVTAISE